jgi:hypothetical protein
MITQAKEKDLVSLLTNDVRNGHCLYFTNTHYSQFYILDEVLKLFGDFKVDTIVLIDPRGFLHNFFQRHMYLRQAYVEMILNDFEVLSKQSESLEELPLVLENLVSELENQYGMNYIDNLSKLENPFISRYELTHYGRKLNLYHINYDVVTILKMLQNIDNQEHYSSNSSVGLFIDSEKTNWDKLGFHDVQDYLEHINFKAHYVIGDLLTKWEGFVKPIPLTKYLTISFENQFLGEYFEMLRK